MENASKALLIAGSVLLGIIVLSLFMVMINSLTDYQQSQVVNERTEEVIAFNNQFAGYMRNDVSGTDIISLINKVVFYNRTKSSSGTGTFDFGAGYGSEPIKLIINFPSNNNQSLAMEVGTNGKPDNKLFNAYKYEFDGTSDLNATIGGGIEYINNLLNNTLLPLPPKDTNLADEYRTERQIHYTEGILKGLMDNKNSSESIFDKNFLTLDEKTIRKRFSDFNIIIGKVYFPLYDKNGAPIKLSTLKNWWEKYLGPDANQKSAGVGYKHTIREELAYYYEYAQFQRGLFKYIPQTTGTIDTYSPSTGRVVYMKFDFTGKFI